MIMELLSFSRIGNRWPIPHHVVDVSGLLDDLVEQRRKIDERIARIQEYEKFNSLSTMERLTSVPPRSLSGGTFMVP